MKKYIIYISLPRKNIIEVFQFNKNNIKKIQQIDIKSEIQPLKIFYEKKIIYAGVRDIPRIITYKIQKDGLLKKINETKTFGNPNHISLDSSKKYLFNSSYSGNCLTYHKLNDKGIPQEKYIIKKNILGCHSSIFHEKYKILFFTSLKSDKVFFEKIKNFHNHKEKKYYLKSKKNSGPRHLDIHPNKKYLYVLHELNNTIEVWDIKKILYEKNFNSIQTIDILPKSLKKNWAADIHISPCGNFLYTCERTSNSISVFVINKKTGILQLIKIYNTEIQPRSFNIDQKGKYLIISGQKSHSISIYRINKNCGSLKKIKKITTNKEPLWIETFLLY
ncbi:beta-propeller fold lactonase family protein [Buchnera aphidicola]|uniref:beta-propeller fold lactonase family protein n=1 Tax=Buchnera aphidicola TaxID=9 RepID=UPI002543E071|nr:beta-propeller fold lactonase family protein [Buchnera aphidicola]WII23480.1 beta-propeller fold lactonase family protein [Buchnera aphidicola (Sipha maydis)]